MFYLLADSTALFKSSSLCMAHLAKKLACIQTTATARRIAYVGAANEDEPAFFELFSAAAAPLQPTKLSHIRYPFTASNLTVLRQADLVVLAGGDVNAGWQKLLDTAFQSCCAELRAKPTIWLGISAGAIHLGAGFLQYVPWFMGAHEEAQQWQQTLAAYQRLRDEIANSDSMAAANLACLGLKFGAAIYVEPITFKIEPLAGETLWL